MELGKVQWNGVNLSLEVGFKNAYWIIRKAAWWNKGLMVVSTGKYVWKNKLWKTSITS
jgi:hypothetical protein